MKINYICRSKNGEQQKYKLKFKEMNEKLKNLIAKCVEKNIYISGQISTNYTVQDLLHTVGVRSIDTMYKRIKKELTSLSTDSLFENANTVKEKNLQLQVDVVREIFSYKQAKAKAATDAVKLREERATKLATLKNIKTTKEFEALGEKSIEELDKEIASLEGAEA